MNKVDYTKPIEFYEDWSNIPADVYIAPFRLEDYQQLRYRFTENGRHYCSYYNKGDSFCKVVVADDCGNVNLRALKIRNIARKPREFWIHQYADRSIVYDSLAHSQVIQSGHNRPFECIHVREVLPHEETQND